MFSFKHYFYVLVSLLCLLRLFTACSDEKVIEPFLKTDLTGETVNLRQDKQSFEVKVMTNQIDWKIAPVEVVDWCSYDRIADGENFIIRFSVDENEEFTQRETEYGLTAPGCQSLKIKIVQLGTEPAVLFDLSNPTKIKQDGEEFLLTVTSNVTYDEPTLPEEVKEWVDIVEQPMSKAFSDRLFKITVRKNFTFQTRTVHINFEAAELKEPADFTIVQDKASTEGLGDTKLNVINAELKHGNVYSQSNASKTIDGDYSTNYSSADINSPQGEYIEIEYELEQPETTNYVRLVQRSNDDKNSLFAKGGIKVLLDGEAESVWETQEEIPFETTQTAGAAVDILVNKEKVKKIRVRIERMTEGINNKNVAIAEFECYRYSEGKNDVWDAQKFFTDETYTQLKDGVNEEDLPKIKNAIIYQLAKGLLDNSYDKRFRFATYSSCKNPTIVAKELTAGSRSKYDNPTGIFFKKGEAALIFVKFKESNVNNLPLTLSIDDFRDGGGHSVNTLKAGLNVITPANDGNGYIRYWSDDEPEVADEVEIHFCFGTQIGYWDVRRKDTDATWPEILKIAETCALDVPNAMIDILGEKVQLQNTVDAFKKWAPDKIKATVDMHDRMLSFEYRMMGLEKNNTVPKNRFFGVRSWGGSPNWNGDRANYPNTEEPMLVPKKFYSGDNIWVFGHEFGHGNQIAQMNGNGWTEVTNNLYCSFAQYMMRNDELSEGYLRLEHESHKRPGTNTGLAGGRINSFLNEAYVEHKQYFMQAATYTVSNGEPDVWNSDVFVRLVPLWQLTMYFEAAERGTDFWSDVHWEAIHDNKSSYTPGERYVNFMKRCIEASNLDLSEFFEGMGLLKVFDNVRVNDYTNATVNITQQMIDEVKALASGKQKPDGGMKYISANSVDAFKNHAQVEGTLNSGVTPSTDYVTVQHSVWKNVVAFETYKGEELTDISIAGTGDTSNKQTRVAYPSGSTKIMAVGYDGTKKEVYKSN